MSRSPSWFIARRYLTARRRQAFISLISAVSILGVGVGVMALIIALALMTGVQSELRNRIVGSTAHVYVYRPDGTPFSDVATERARLTLPGVVGVAPAILGPGLLKFGEQEQPITLKGVDPASEPSVTDIARATKSGSLNALVRPDDELDGVMLGDDLATALNVRVGDEVDLITTSPQPTILGVQPRQRPLQVVGTFRFGFYEIDTSQAFVTIKTAQEMLNRQGADMMQIRLADMNDADHVKDLLQKKLGSDYLVKDWMEQNSSLYSALSLEKLAISLTIGLIVFVAALNIVASLVLLVMEKTRDIAILRTMGAPAAMIRRIFIYQGLTIGAVGTGAGTIFGLVGSYVADRYQLIKLPSDVYQISYLPFRALPLDVVLVVSSALVVCLLATLYPSRQAGRIDPAEALRNQ